MLYLTSVNDLAPEFFPITFICSLSYNDSGLRTVHARNMLCSFQTFSACHCLSLQCFPQGSRLSHALIAFRCLLMCHLPAYLCRITLAVLCACSLSLICTHVQTEAPRGVSWPCFVSLYNI